jgi:hypothetical protein
MENTGCPTVKPKTPIRLLWVLAVICAVPFAGCAWMSAEPPAGERYRVSNEGYGLLYDLTGNEQNVDKILLVKTATAQVAAEIKHIAQLLGQAHEQLDAFAKQDPLLRFGTTRLLTVEQKTRESIASQTTKGLLVSRGREFDLHLLLTQVQALQYASHLAQELAAGTTTPTARVS